MNTINCRYCGIEIYYNTKYGKYFEVKYVGMKDFCDNKEFDCEVLHNIIECKQANENKARKSDTNTGDENKPIDNDLTIGYRTLKNTIAYFPKSEPKIYAALSTKKDITNYPNYNKLKISYLYCLSCNKQTEHQPLKDQRNIIKCLVCANIKLNPNNPKSRVWCGDCRHYKKSNGVCFC